MEQHKQELGKISKTLKQVDLYNEDLRSKIMVAKRTTLKAEEDIVKQEVEKKRQVCCPIDPSPSTMEAMDAEFWT